MKNKSNYTVFLPVLFLSFLTITSCSDTLNWPQFRGPDSNMLPSGKNLPEEWGTDKNIKWMTELDGTGYSSPIIWGNKIFITSAFPVKVNPVPERGPMQGPPPQGKGERQKKEIREKRKKKKEENEKNRKTEKEIKDKTQR